MRRWSVIAGPRQRRRKLRRRAKALALAAAAAVMLLAGSWTMRPAPPAPTPWPDATYRGWMENMAALSPGHRDGFERDYPGVFGVG